MQVINGISLDIQTMLCTQTLLQRYVVDLLQNLGCVVCFSLSSSFTVQNTETREILKYEFSRPHMMFEIEQKGTLSVRFLIIIDMVDTVGVVKDKGYDPFVVSASANDILLGRQTTDPVNDWKDGLVLTGLNLAIRFCERCDNVFLRYVGFFYVFCTVCGYDDNGITASEIPTKRKTQLAGLIDSSRAKLSQECLLQSALGDDARNRSMMRVEEKVKVEEVA